MKNLIYQLFLKDYNRQKITDEQMKDVIVNYLEKLLREWYALNEEPNENYYIRTFKDICKLTKPLGFSTIRTRFLLNELVDDEERIDTYENGYLSNRLD